MKIITLDQVPFSELTDCFNEAFSDYFVKFHVTESYLKEKWHGANADYSLSVGVLDGEKLVGFIVNGIREWQGLKTAYNGGTGVIPSHRGNGYTKKMYDFLFPKLKTNDVKSLSLEVIQQNVKAIHLYEKVGMKIQRALNCYGGEVNLEIPEMPNSFSFQKIETPNWKLFQSFHDVIPAWENNKESIQQNISKYEFYGVEKNNLSGEQADNTIAFVIVKPENGYMPQFGVHPDFRRQGVGKFMFAHLAQIFPTLKTNNVDASAKHILEFLEKNKLKNSINQYEMVSYL